MIAVEQLYRADSMHAAVAERKLGTPGAAGRKKCFMSDAAERKHHNELRHSLDGRGKKGAAIGDLSRCRFVFRRHAAHRVGDAAIDQREAVVRPRAIVAFGQAELVQRPVEEFAGIVAGEWPSGSVGAAQARRESDNKKSGIPRTERWYRCVEPLRLARAPSLAKGGKARAPRAVATRCV